jgi:hypothetical protein
MASNEEIEIKVSVDTSDAVDGFKDIEKGSDKMAKSVTKDGKDIEKSLDGVEKSAKDIQSAFKKIDMKSLTSSLSNMKKQVSSIATNIKKQLQDALNVKSNINAKIDVTTDVSSGNSGSSANMIGSMMTGGAMGSQIAKTLAQIQPTVNSVKKSFKDLPQQLQSDMSKAIADISNEFQHVINVTENLKDMGFDFSNDEKDLRGIIKGLKDSAMIKYKAPNLKETFGTDKFLESLMLVPEELDVIERKTKALNKIDFSLDLDEEFVKLDELFKKYNNQPLKINAQPIIEAFERLRQKMHELGMDTSFMDAMFDEWDYICKNGTKSTIELGNAMRSTRSSFSALNLGVKEVITNQAMQVQKQRELNAVSKESSVIYQTLQKALINAKYGFKQFGSDLKSLFASMKNNSKVLDETAKKAKKLGQETKKASKQIKSATTGIAASFKSLLTSMLPFMTVIGAFNLLKDSTTKAMDAIEDTNMYMAVFGSRAKEMDEWIEQLSKDTGLGIGQTKKFTAIIQQMGSAMGLTGQDAMEMSQSMAKMAGDISSFYNVDIIQAQEDLRSALSGSNEVNVIASLHRNMYLLIG